MSGMSIMMAARAQKATAWAGGLARRRGRRIRVTAAARHAFEIRSGNIDCARPSPHGAPIHPKDLSCPKVMVLMKTSIWNGCQ
ncbi:hypothetical protein D3869_32560 (plasmid) [Azospirillum brasilense]|uniref:Uncharacterized protein n=1 Tax=Azospirillum brasilense TaxID=192 RepID=A0A4D8RTC0_AZOBR|nr:hypothetical protein D3869_32560 [Azospirillum brasilense]